MKSETEIPADVMDELRVAVERASKGARDPDAVRKACERMNRIREELRVKHGLVDIAVPTIRELRDA